MPVHPLPRRPASPLSLAPPRAPKRPRHEPGPTASTTLSSSYRPRARVRADTPSSACSLPSASEPSSASSSSDTVSVITPISARLGSLADGAPVPPPQAGPGATLPRSPLLHPDELSRKADEVIARLTGSSNSIERKAEDVIARLEREARIKAPSQATSTSLPLPPYVALGKTPFQTMAGPTPFYWPSLPPASRPSCPPRPPAFAPAVPIPQSTLKPSDSLPAKPLERRDDTSHGPPPA